MKKRFKLPVGELYKFFGLLDTEIEIPVELKRYVGIKNQTGVYKKINHLVKKRGMVKTYKLENGIDIKCDENHLVRSNNTFVNIKDASEVDTIFGTKKIGEIIPDKIKDVYDFSLDSPHEYITSDGVICHNTTLAKLITNAIDCDVLSINASDENGIEVIRNKIKNFASTVGFKGTKIIILDEADFLTPPAQATLRNLMETFSKHCRFILTCNYIEKISSPIQSRCQDFQIVPPSKKEVAMQVANILTKENIKFEIVDIVPIIDASYPDIRKIINTVQLNSSRGVLKLNKKDLMDTDVKSHIVEILKSDDVRGNKYKAIRQAVADARINDFTDVYKFLYEKVDAFGGDKTSSIILLLAEGQYKEAMCIDKEIPFMACIINILSL